MFLKRLRKAETDRAKGALAALDATVKEAAIKQLVDASIEKAEKNLSSTHGAHGATLLWAPGFELDEQVKQVWEKT